MQISNQVQTTSLFQNTYLDFTTACVYGIVVYSEESSIWNGLYIRTRALCPPSPTLPTWHFGPKAAQMLIIISVDSISNHLLSDGSP